MSAAPRARGVRARWMISLAEEEPSVGRRLFSPLRIQENALLACVGDVVVYAGPYDAAQTPPGAEMRDLGDAVLVPAAVNAHTHLQLSHLAGRTLWGRGFAPWLQSLVPLLSLPLEEGAMRRAAAAMAAAGTAHVGDFTGRGAVMAGRAVLAAGLGCTLLGEWFGFASAPADAVWPPCFPPPEEIPAPLRTAMAPAGHALYSTAPDILRKAHAWCRAHGRPFALHLAESIEETRMLCAGDGPLAEVYAPAVLPPNWRAPGLPPVAAARRQGLLGPETLAVHCVQCGVADAAVLAETGAHVCLCPRSNANLAVGAAPARLFAEAGVRLCLGTDGLSSNMDADVWQDALALLRAGALPATALLRMLTLNGAAALGRDDVGALKPGRRARWAVLPPDMRADLADGLR